MLKITRNSGFVMTFQNGWTVSVQWGAGNYCQHRDAILGMTMDKMLELGRGTCLDFVESEDAEVAAWDKDNNWHDFGSDEVYGWLKPDQVVAFLAGIATGHGNPSKRKLTTDETETKALPPKSDQ